MTSISPARYGVYFAPTGVLWACASAWLGRDAKSGCRVRPQGLGNLGENERCALTESPRHYGLHATLKPPFHLAAGRTEEDLFAALARVASRHSPATLPRLEVVTLGSFVALRFAQPAPAIDALAEDCVRALDSFRARPDEAELARRRAKGLTARQDDNLRRFGYPYVLAEYRFHITLTNAISDPAKRAALVALLRDYLAGALDVAPVLEAISVYRQDDRDAPFLVRAQFDCRGEPEFRGG